MRVSRPFTAILLLLLASATASAAEWTVQERLAGEDLDFRHEGEGLRPDFPGALRYAAPGDHDLPARLLRLPLPAGERLVEYREELSAPLTIPRSGPWATVPLLRDETGTEVAPVSGPPRREPGLDFLGEQWVSGRRELVFLWRPVAVSGGELLLSASLTLHLRSESDPTAPLLPLRGREGGAGGPFAPRERPSLDGSPVDAVIVTSTGMEPAFQRLADWHVLRGTRTVVRSVDWIAAHYPPGRDRGENIRFFLQDAYALWGLRAVILGGDSDVIPARYGYVRAGGLQPEPIPTDLYYSCLDGNWNGDGDELWGEAPLGGLPGDDADLLPELWVGRLPVSSFEQADELVDKLIAYRETTRDDFQDRITLFAEVLFPPDWGPGDDYWEDGARYAVGVMDSCLSADMTPAPLFENWTDPIYVLWDPAPLNVEAAYDSMNTGGFALVDHNGHGFRYNMSVGDGSILVSHALGLTNDVPFHITLMNCTSTAFDFDCLGENFLRNPRGGAVGVFGTTRSSYPFHSYPYQAFYYQRLFLDGIRRPGAIMQALRENKWYYSLIDGYARWTYFIVTFLGDPLLDLWSGSARSYDLTAPAGAIVGEQLLDFHVETDGEAAEGARLTLYKEGEVWASGSSDALGDCQLPARPLSEGALTLTVWGPNAFQQSLSIPVSGVAEPFVHLETAAIDDEVVHDPLNNGDGVLDGGESPRLILTLRNGGGGAASAVSIDLVSLDDSLSVLAGHEDFGTIAAGQSATGTGELAISAALGSADGTLLRALVQIDDGRATRSDTLILDLHAPRPVLAEWSVSDSPYGDGDGIFEESEELHAQPRYVNLGGGATGSLNATLLSLDPPDLEILDSAVTIPSLSLLADGMPNPGFRISMVDPGLEYHAELTLTGAFGRVWVDTLEFVAPEAPSGIISDSSLAPDRIALSWEPSTSTDVRAYHVYAAQHAPADFARFTLLPIEHTAVIVDGLQENSLSYFYVTAVDSSGMESAPSATHETSTNPAQLSGFPQEIQGASSSSPAVGNLAGDTELELVCAADYVYAWHHDGVEVRDGDGSSETSGVFSIDARNIAGSVILLPLLGDSHRQVVVGTLGDAYGGVRGIYALGGDGSVLPGWPRETSDWIWANIVGADLDGDGDIEIAGVDIDGFVYAFHHDGSELVPGSGGVLASGVGNWTISSPAAADLDGDGADELVLMGKNERLYAWKGDGSLLAGFPVNLDPAGAVLDYRSKCPVIVGNLDGDPDGVLEILVQSEADSLFAFSSDGSPLEPFPIPLVSNNADIGPGPIPLDLDHDGDLELFVVETIGGYNSFLHLFEHDGSERAGWPVSLAAHAQASPIAGDLDGDGLIEFVLGTEQGIIYGFQEDGSVQPGFPIGVGGEVRGTPALADLDHDGDVELIAATWNRRILVWDFDGAFGEQGFPWPTISGNYYRTGRAGDWDNVPVLAHDVSLEQEGGVVTVAWSAGDPTIPRWGLERERRLPGGVWGERTLLSGDLPREGERFTWRDDTVVGGERYYYHALAYDGPVAQSIALGIIDVETPAWRDRFVGAYPNPFNPSTTLVFESARRARLSLSIYAPDGRLLRRLLDETLAAGRHELVWDGRDGAGRPLASGLYLAHLGRAGGAETRRLVLLK